MNKELKYFGKKRNIVSLIVIAILLVAVPVTLYLAQTRQIFQPRAQEAGTFDININPNPLNVSTSTSVTVSGSANVSGEELDHIDLKVIEVNSGGAPIGAESFWKSVDCPGISYCPFNEVDNTFNSSDANKRYMYFIVVWYLDQNTNSVQLWCSGRPGSQDLCGNGSEVVSVTGGTTGIGYACINGQCQQTTYGSLPAGCNNSCSSTPTTGYSCSNNCSTPVSGGQYTTQTQCFSSCTLTGTMNLQATMGSCTNNLVNVNLSWNKYGTSAYTLKRDNTVTINSYNATGTNVTATDTNVPVGNRTYTLQALSGGSTVVASETKTINVTCSNTGTIQINISQSACTNNSATVTISWPNTNGVTYSLFRDPSGTSNGTAVLLSGVGTTMTATDNNVPAGNHTYRLVANGVNNDKPFTVTCSGSTTGYSCSNNCSAPVAGGAYSTQAQCQSSCGGGTPGGTCSTQLSCWPLNYLIGPSQCSNAGGTCANYLSQCSCQPVVNNQPCNATPICTGACTAPANTCSANNGTQASCNFTTGSANCVPAAAPVQPCTVDSCQAGNVCNNGQCVLTNNPNPPAGPNPNPPAGGTTQYKLADGDSVNSCSAALATSTTFRPLPANPIEVVPYHINSANNGQKFICLRYYNASGAETSSLIVSDISLTTGGTTPPPPPGGNPPPPGNNPPPPTGNTPPPPTGNNPPPGVNPPPAGVNPPPSVLTPPPPNLSGLTRSYKIAESEAGLATAIERPYTTHPTVRSFDFLDKTPGIKQVWVQFIAGDDTPTRPHRQTIFAQIELVGPDPVISGCNVNNLGSGNIEFIIKGTNFGSGNGSIKSDSTNLTVTRWTDTEVKATWPAAPAVTSFPVTLTRTDSQAVNSFCSGISQIYLGAQLFCRQPQKFDATGVEIAIAEGVTGGKKFTETVTIDKNGIIQGLKTQLEVGKPYKLSIKVPKSVRRSFEFIAQAGTTTLGRMVNNQIRPLLLPVGNIFPLGNDDGSINTGDYSQMIREWVIDVDRPNRSADFNQDNRVNSGDWACMRRDFGAQDEPEVVPGPLVTLREATGSARPNNASPQESTNPSATEDPSPTSPPNNPGSTSTPAPGGIGRFRVSCLGSPNPAQVGQTVTWVANVVGGSGNYVFSWSGASSSNSSSNTATATYASPQNQITSVIVKDLTLPSGYNTITNSCSVEVVN